MSGENPASRLTDGRDTCTQIAHEDRLGDDRAESAVLGRQDAQERAIDRCGLTTCVRDPRGWLAVKEQFRGRKAFNST